MYKIIHVVETPETHGIIIFQMAALGAEIEIGKFHCFRVEPDQGAEIMDLDSASFYGRKAHICF